MATIVCQGLQSYLESLLVDPLTLGLRLSSPTPHFSKSLELALRANESHIDYQKPNFFHDDNHHHHPDDVGCWRFLQALASNNTPQQHTTYVHPLMKSYSSSKLSHMNLELCTESIGSETGTHETIESSIFETPRERINSSPTKAKQENIGHFVGSKKANSRNFPPPLTTMTGAYSIHVKPHREDGRLVIEAVKTPSSKTCFQAERSDGRLRLCFVKHSSADFDSFKIESDSNNHNDKVDENFDNENDIVDGLKEL